MAQNPHLVGVLPIPSIPVTLKPLLSTLNIVVLTTQHLTRCCHFDKMDLSGGTMDAHSERQGFNQIPSQAPIVPQTD